VPDRQVHAIHGDKAKPVLAEPTASHREALHQIDRLQERLSHR
jgi:predicted NAD/FAD-binding protein